MMPPRVPAGAEAGAATPESDGSARFPHVYVHVPFCARRCSYCDFAIAVRRTVPVDEFLGALERDLARQLPAGSAEPLRTLYFGGGTPSRLGGEGVARAIALVTERAPLATDAEVTIEANPEDVTPDAAAAWRAAGVNRLSLGSQSFAPGVLEWMHRTHDAGAIGRAVAVARGAGIDNLSLDLIFALPDELDRDWDADIARVLELEPDHISLYGLTVEEGTPLARWRERGETHEAPEDRFEREFLHAHDRLAAAGFEHYEVSNYARAGRRSRHNSAYWSRTPYLGLGPSAHSFDGARRWWNRRDYADWVRALGEGADPVAGAETLTPEQVQSERTYLGLRTTGGLALPPGGSAAVADWVREGWGIVSDGTLRLTPLGWLRLDALAASLTHVASRS